jgi:L-ascorbate metabolism protein UlaG (beta-lactamase superfamily)
MPARLPRRAAIVVAAALTMLAAGLPGARASCQLLANAGDFPLLRANLATDEVAIRYIGHATFEIETPKGVRIATDYNAVHRPARLPRVVTMNGAHRTHFTPDPEPEIEHVLLGWNPAGGPMTHDLTVEDVRIRNLQTATRTWGGETRLLGNSIFVFEVADLCIAHLGHLHHRLTDEDLARLGTIDIVMAPVDNATTLRLDSMVAVLSSLKPRIVIPMHAHTHGSLESFLARMAVEGYEVARSAGPLFIARRAELPERARVLVLPGG